MQVIDIIKVDSQWTEVTYFVILTVVINTKLVSTQYSQPKIFFSIKMSVILILGICSYGVLGGEYAFYI